MYRRQKFWSDLADQQHESEQHACLVQFLGIGERLFSTEYADLVTKEKRVRALEFERDQYLEILDKVSRELLDAKELGVALTPASIEDATNRLTDEISASTAKRNDALKAALAEVKPDPAAQEPIEQMGKELADLRARQDDALQSLRKALGRSAEIAEQKRLLEEESSRLERAKVATRLLPRLKITHCPACDQAIDEPSDAAANPCFLCRRERPPAPGSADDADRRLEFERAQIQAELKENDELLAEVAKDIKKLNDLRAEIAGRIRNLEESLRPVRTAIAALVPAAVSVIDVESGRLQERLKQLERVKAALAKRENLNEQIKKIQEEVAKLEREVRERKTEVDFMDANQRLEDGINTYLNRISEASKGSWTQDAPIRVSIRDREFSIKVGKWSWQGKLGGTQTLLFLLAYQYALLSLTPVEACHYPGFAALDFQAKLEDGSPGITRDKENFVLRPFIKLLGSKGIWSFRNSLSLTRRG
jgi:DNA repair exonuclease SbcCD ATPase subunit